MEIERKNFRYYVEQTLPWFVLIILLIYTYSKFFVHPYGFRFDTVTGKILYVFVEYPEPTLKVGDQLVKIGSVTWEDFHADLRVTFFNRVKEGDIVPVVVERSGQTLTIPWKYPGLNIGDFYDQLPSEWLLAYFFWLAGTLTILILRPKDERWFLLVGFNFLTAIWLITGSGNSAYHTWYSALILRMAIWLSVPVYLHLHWVFPRPLGKLPPLLIGIVYIFFLGMVVAQAMQLLPPSLYYLGFVVALFGSLLLLIAHAVLQPTMRKDLRLLLLAFFLALFPSIVIGIASNFIYFTPGVSSLGLLSLPLIPFGYLYTASRRQLGEVEVRINRLISIYLFLILLGTILVPPVFLILSRVHSPEQATLITMTTGIMIVLLTVFGFPRFQNFVERRWLGIRLPFENLLEVYSARITMSTSLADLVKLLKEEVVPSLLVRQFAFIRLEEGSNSLLFSLGDVPDYPPDSQELSWFMNRTSKVLPHSNSKEHHPWSWVRLVIPLKIETNSIGVWLFGRRDPDDTYPAGEIAILQSLANQTAIALSYILQTERLRTLYQANINRYEEERLRLALDLHDSVLNQAAAMLMNTDASTLSPGFQKAYDQLTQRLREIVSALRPPMLNYGLKPALEALAENLMEKNGSDVNIEVNLDTSDISLPAPFEQHLYRIVEEACENSLKHGKARNILLFGKIDPQEVNLLIKDDGIGFDMEKGLQIENLLLQKHFGLVGMIERAHLLDAKLIITSSPGLGTQIQFNWKPGNN